MMRKTRPSLFAAIIAFAFSAAPALAQPQAQQPQAQAPRTQAQASTYTDTQLRAYAAAKAEIGAPGQTASDTRRTEILRRHNLTSETYAAIDAAARADRALQQRIATLSQRSSPNG